MTIVKDYLDYTKNYKIEFGEKTLVLMQVGSFFEVYGLLDNNGSIIGSDIQQFSEICDMTISKKIGQVDGKNVMMAGFGIAQLDKYLKKLQEVGYTIPVFVQDSPSKNTTRSLYQIVSPGTFFSNDSKELSNNISCIWIHKFNFMKSNKLLIGISNVDIFTGKSNISEFTKEYFHNSSTYDDLERFISIYNPNEILLTGNLDCNCYNDIIQFAQINSSKIHILNNDDKKIKNSEKQTYQEEIIERFFSHNNFSTIFENLKNYQIASQSFTLLLDFIYSHNPNLINRISEPNFEDFGSRLLLANHSLKQLNIINDSRYSGKFSSITNLLNNCVTPIGKRNFNYLLLNPSIDIDYIQYEYDITEFMLEQQYLKIREKLCNIKDIEKLYRKSIMKKVTPKDITIFYQNTKILQDISNEIKNLDYLKNYINKRNCINSFNEITDEITNISNFIKKNLDINISILIDDVSVDKLNTQEVKKIKYINSNLSADIDKYYKESIESVQQFEAIKKYLNDCIINYEKSAKTNDFIKIHETAKMDPTLQTTKRRATFLQKFINENKESKEIYYYSEYSCENCKFYLDLSQIEIISNGSNNSTMIVTSKKIREITSSMNNSKSKFINSMELFFNNFVFDVLKFNIKLIIDYVSILDLLQNKCYLCHKYNYCKPQIIISDKSFLSVKGLRHCLIEQINKKEIYVTNDFELGNNNQDGILLYGTNAVGKTSFIKSIGIIIIMAQAGLYVPANSLSYMPYNSLFTRILGNDNLFKGLSTFAVEMSELRTILKSSDSNSLILGDELCSGTESDSALSIFVSGLEILHKNKSSFMFATHFHEIVNYQEIKDLTRMQLYHMTVFYDTINDCLIYDRKLKLGSGDSMYGLEVCKSLNLPEKFLERAHELRVKYNKNYESILDLDGSKYNKNVLKGKCKICNKCKAVEVHHLQYQIESNDKGFITNNNNNFHKNHPANLIGICEICHDKIHSSNLKYCIKKTTKGYQLIKE